MEKTRVQLPLVVNHGRWQTITGFNKDQCSRLILIKPGGKVKMSLTDDLSKHKLYVKISSIVLHVLFLPLTISSRPGAAEHSMVRKAWRWPISCLHKTGRSHPNFARLGAMHSLLKTGHLDSGLKQES
jgi:hypothetical protein